VDSMLGGLANVLLTEPLDYVDFVHVMRRSALIVTDSGGVQEEAPALGVPVLVAREVTERPEGIEAGAARIVGSDPAKICSAVAELLEDPEARAGMAQSRLIYGDGLATDRVVSALLSFSRAAETIPRESTMANLVPLPPA